MKSFRLIKSFVFTGAVLLLLSGNWAAGADAGKFSLDDTPGQHLDVLLGGRILARYMDGYDVSTPEKRIETYKPYLHVFDPEGREPITKGTGGQYPHHRGIFIGWDKITCNGRIYDRWHMKGGEQIHRQFLAREADAEHASFTSLVDWTDENGKPFITEERAMTFRRAPVGAYELIDFSSKIKAAGGDIVLDGDPEHAGIHYRPAIEVDRNKTLFVFPGENVDVRKATNLPWIAETYSLKNRLFSVVEINHPDNPQDTKISAYRDYGRIGFFPKTAIKAGESFTFKYRFLIAEGAMLPAATIQQCCNEYTGRKDPTPQLTVKPAEKTAVAKPKGVQPQQKAVPTP